MYTDEAVLDYADAARDLRQLAAGAALRISVVPPYTPVELYAFAAIAERAADAEVANPPLVPQFCGVCGHLLVCDWDAHRAVRS